MIKRKPKTKTLESILAPFTQVVTDLEAFIKEQTAVATAKKAHAAALKNEAADHILKVCDAKQSLVKVKTMMPKGGK